MAIVYSTLLKTNRMTLVSDLISSKVFAASTGTALAGKLVIGTSALAGSLTTGVLATILLPVAPFTITNAVATLLGVPLTANAVATGVAARAEFRNSANAVIVSGLTVGTAGTNIIIPNTSITTGNPVVITAGTLTHG